MQRSWLRYPVPEYHAIDRSAGRCRKSATIQPGRLEMRIGLGPFDVTSANAVPPDVMMGEPDMPPTMSSSACSTQQLWAGSRPPRKNSQVSHRPSSDNTRATAL